MRDSKIIQPPRWAQRFLEWYCKPEVLEDLQGDLFEYYQRNLRSKGRIRANLIYVVDVFKFLRPYTLRKPEFIKAFIHWIMLGSYVRTSGRNIVRNKLFSFINIFGLSISMSVGLLMIAMLSDLFSYDKFHLNHDRIYRVISNHQYLDHKSKDYFATTSLKAATTIKESFPGVESVAILRNDFSGDVSAGEKTIRLSGFYANSDLFRVFSFKLKQGNPVTVLANPFSIVLTEKSAEKLFGDTNALGKTIRFNNDKEYTVTGVAEDVPVFSHIKFEMLCSLSTREILNKDSEDENAWDNIWYTWAYVLLKEGADLGLLQQNLDMLSEREDKTVEHTHVALALYPMDEIMMGENQSNQIGPVMGRTVVSIFSALTIIVLLSACFNYTNLSIARAFRRSREVGIRKTIGALKSHVAIQFTVESIIISLLALMFSFMLFLLLRSHFISLEYSLQQLLILDLTPTLILYFVLFAMVVGVLAGLFPAIFFSRLNAIQVLKGISAIPKFNSLALRKTLIVFQYSISIIAISATTIIYKQYKHFIAYDLGFSTANILNIQLQGNKAEHLKKELAELPEVQSISESALIQSIGHNWATNMKNPAIPLDSGTAFYNVVDENYLPLHDYTLLAGRNFKQTADNAEESEVIVNEHVLKRFDIAAQDPHEAIGQIVKVDGKTLQIIGVMKNFEYGKADNNRMGKEVIMRYSKKDARYLNVKILSEDWPATYAKIETIWKQIDSVHPLNAKFYEKEIEDSFGGLKASIKVGGFLAFLVICIASIGLLGMVVFTSETRLKEISIRKVMGASEGNLLYLLSKGFFILLMLSSSIALPVTYFFFENILLPNIANHAPLSLPEMFIGVLIVLGIAISMIASHTIKVSRTNPADVLKTE